MAQTRNGNVVYELSGRALDAAKRLEQELRKELQTVPVKQSGNLKEIGDSWDAMYKGLLARLAKEAPEVLELTGLKAPATQVFKGVQTLPRAYREYPQIFTSPEQQPRYFMYAPVDYKGDHFTPADSKKLGGKEEARVGDLLFAGGWLGNAPIVGVRKEGVATPADYKPPSASALRKQFSYMPNDRVCFIAGGRSLALVKDFRARNKDWEKRLKTACRAIENAAGKKKNIILANLPLEEEVRISATYSYSSGGGDKATLLLSARREGKDNLWNAGKTVNMPDSPAYKLTPRQGGEYVVTPRRDTPEGKKLAALIDAIPLTPGLRDYPELFADYALKKDKIGQMLGVNGTVPQVVAVEGLTVLLYNAAPADKKKSFCPPGATPLPTPVYEWLRSDEGDRNMSISPPPRPAIVSKTLAEAKKQAAPKPKKPGF
jgi:hypothetical protein